MMIDLPPEFQGLVEMVDTQPVPVREAFHYCLCLMLVETGHMCFVEHLPGESGAICRFETVVGEQFAIPRPNITPAQEDEILDVLRQILVEEGLL